MTLIVSVVFVVGYFLIGEHGAWRRLGLWRNLLAAALLALPFLLAATWPYFQLSLAGNGNHRSLAEVDVWSASPTDFILPAPVHFIWGNWIRSHFDRSLWIEQTLYIGVVTLLLLGSALLWRKHAPETAKTFGLLSWASAWAVILAMGTTLHWLGKRLDIDVPTFLLPILSRWHPGSQVPIPLPGFFLFLGMPFYNGMRVWIRYGVYVNLFAAVLAGIGYASLSKTVKRQSINNLLLLLTVALIGVDYYPGFPVLSEVKPRPVDQWLAAQPGDGAVAQFPIGMSTEPTVIYGTLTHNKPLLGMFYGAYLPTDFARLMPELNNFPDEASLQLIRERGVQYVLVDSSKYSAWESTRKRIEKLGLSLVTIIGEEYVYRLSAP